MRVDLKEVEEACKELYIRALKLLPPDIKEGFKRLDATETDADREVDTRNDDLNIKVAEDNQNLLCQDTGIPIYNVEIGSGVEVDGYKLKQAIIKGCERATREHPLRSSVVHPVTRKNEHTSCGRLVPVINIDFVPEAETLSIEMIPKGSGSENNSWLKMAVPADGIDAIKTFVVDCVLDAGGKTCPPTIVGVGVGGTADLCVHLSKVAATRPLGSRCDDPEGAKLEAELSKAVNQLGVGPQGLGGDSTSFAVHVETAATHITMNPVAVNMQCHSARRARPRFTPKAFTALSYGVLSRDWIQTGKQEHGPLRLRHADHRSRRPQAQGERHRHAERHALRHPRRDADPYVRPRPHDALRHERPRGRAYRAQREMGRRDRRRIRRATRRSASAPRRARAWSASRGR